MQVVPFNRPHVTGREFGYIREAMEAGHLSAGGQFTQRCSGWLETATGAPRALLTHSGTGALELAALLAGLEPGDEVIMPAFTFVSTATAIALRRAVPVFVDIDPRTLNLSPEAVEEAIGPRTRAVVAVHYAGIGCDMDALCALTKRYGLILIEDAAHALPGTWAGRMLGTFGSLAAISFHETKNVTCGEGGALIVNDPALVERAEIMHENGTDRRAFLLGRTDKYIWQDLGSSFAPSEVSAAFLWSQLDEIDAVTADRRVTWRRYHQALEDLERQGALRRPVVPVAADHNAHLYYVLLPEDADRTDFIRGLDARGVQAVFHYVPLHTSPAGLKYGRAAGPLPVTEEVSERLVRLPLWSGMDEAAVDQVVDAIRATVRVPTLWA